MKEFGVSVVIPTLNRDEFLFDSINDMLNQDYNNYEILVVDQSDNINEKIEELVKDNSEKIKYFRNLGFKGLPQARNFGWQNAKYEIILYIDDDIRADNQFIKNHSENYKNKEIGIVGGKVIEQGMGKGDLVGRINPWTFNLVTNFSSDKSQFVEHVKGCNFSVRKSLLEKIKGFDETISIGAALYEELEMILRAKSKCKTKVYFDAKAVLNHLVAIDGGCRVKDVSKYMFSLSRNRTILIGRYFNWYHKITAYIRLILLGLSYSRTDKSFDPLFSTFTGMKAGMKAGNSEVICGNYAKKD